MLKLHRLSVQSWIKIFRLILFHFLTDVTLATQILPSIHPALKSANFAQARFDIAVLVLAVKSSLSYMILSGALSLNSIFRT